MSASMLLHHVGETVQVLYDPRDPEEACIAGGFNYFAPVVLLVMGIGFCALGAAVLGHSR